MFDYEWPRERMVTLTLTAPTAAAVPPAAREGAAVRRAALVCLVGFRMMGAMLPASLEMIRRLPPFEGIHPENIGIAFDYLVSNDVLEFIHDEKSGEGAFHWAALDRLVSAALAEADAPKLLGPDGQPTTGLLFQ